ncbi:hypothetical protein HY78_29140 (plasmid) [Rhizorhabdus wittichii DC-6]|nr:hypothetical protein HY78_29140 [Rhizorhabdus wittichii DC-6]
MTGDGVPVWCFEGPDLWALAGDEAGHALPADMGPWTFKKMLVIGSSDPDEAEALQLIRENGFCCFDPAPTDSKEADI